MSEQQISPKEYQDLSKAFNKINTTCLTLTLWHHVSTGLHISIISRVLDMDEYITVLFAQGFSKHCEFSLCGKKGGLQPCIDYYKFHITVKCWYSFPAVLLGVDKLKEEHCFTII